MKEFIDNLIRRFEEEPVSSISMGKDYLINGNAIPKERAIAIVNQLAEEYKDKSSIIDDLKAFLKEKFKYNSEQAEIWADGSDTDSYFRQQKDLYMDRANIYGEVVREIDRLSEGYKSFGNSEQVKTSELPTGWIPVSVRLPDTEHISGVSESVLVTTNVHSIFTAEYHRNGKWLDDVGDWSLDVIAWMPLPAPFKEGE